MPGYRAHIGGGIGLYILLMSSLTLVYTITPPFFTALGWFLCAVLGSLFPDIDTKSKGQLLFYRVLALVLVYCLLKGYFVFFIFLSLFSLLPLIVRHRGLFHEIWFVVVLSVVLFFTCHGINGVDTPVKGMPFLFFVGGALSHIFLDKLISGFKRRKFIR